MVSASFIFFSFACAFDEAQKKVKPTAITPPRMYFVICCLFHSAPPRGKIKSANRPKAATAALVGARKVRDTLDITTPPNAAPIDAPRYRAELFRASAKFDWLEFAAMARCC